MYEYESLTKHTQDFVRLPRYPHVEGDQCLRTISKILMRDYGDDRLAVPIMCRSNSLPVIQAGGGSYVFHTSPKQDTGLSYQDSVKTVADGAHGP